MKKIVITIELVEVKEKTLQESLKEQYETELQKIDDIIENNKKLYSMFRQIISEHIKHLNENVSDELFKPSKTNLDFYLTKKGFKYTLFSNKCGGNMYGDEVKLVLPTENIEHKLAGKEITEYKYLQDPTFIEMNSESPGKDRYSRNSTTKVLKDGLESQEFKDLIKKKLFSLWSA